MRPRLELRLQQKLVMTPQLQQAIRLLQLSRLELSQTITNELMENPVLEEELSTDAPEDEGPSGEESPAAKTEGETETPEREAPESAELDPQEFNWDSYFEQDDFGLSGEGDYGKASSEDLPSYEQTLSKPTSLEEHLLWQLRLSNVPDEDRVVGETIIGNVDDDGYLRVELEEIAKTAQCSLPKVEQVLKLIQGFDPVGVAARDLRECLQIQIRQLGLQGSLVESIVANHLPDLEKKRFPAIAKSLGVSADAVFQAAKVIEHLEPKPGRPFGSSDNVYITPDVFVVKIEGKYAVLLNDDGLPRLRINQYYRRLLKNKVQGVDPTKTYVEDKLRSALWLIRSIEQRNRTIVRVAESIVKFQYEFIEKGINFLKPLILKQVAEDIGMHESTISRVTTNKYMYTPQGIFELKFFFNSGISRVNGAGDDLSSVTVRERIRQLVANEDPRHPLTDHELVERLSGEQIAIARRTVAKYRGWLRIPPANQRKRAF
ncbi:MAG TPA: RNA polymerase factor sigma-54 [Nitrospiria bacterium]|nr:RNA polymerase factor sigma-54 [Nitrospiria bacterium]